jgi:hypothetical protein
MFWRILFFGRGSEKFVISNEKEKTKVNIK